LLRSELSSDRKAVQSMTPTNPPPPDMKASGTALAGESLLRPEDAARLLSVKTSWVYEAVRTRQLPCVRVGRYIRFTPQLLEKWLADNTEP
jgi:excisionase family DNA binding protein